MQSFLKPAVSLIFNKPDALLENSQDNFRLVMKFSNVTCIYIVCTQKDCWNISMNFLNLKFKTDILIRYFYQYTWNPYLHKLLRVHHKMDFLSFVIRHYIFKLWILIKHLQLIKARHMIHMRCTCSTLLCFKMIVLINYSGFLNMVKKLKPNLLQMYWVNWIHVLTNLMEQSASYTFSQFTCTCTYNIFQIWFW